MYRLVELEEIVRISPGMLRRDFDQVVKETLKGECEGRIYKSIGMILFIEAVDRVGDGEIVPGDGSVYQKTHFRALVFSPEDQEIVEGRISQIAEFGAFLNFGPLDGLIHVSQVMDDFVDVDMINGRIVGKNSKKTLRVDDICRARIVSLSLNENDPKLSRIGLTMRQPGLGALQWLEEKKEEVKSG